MGLRKRSGFTLIEILLVVGAIAILAGIVILAINPGKQMGETRNAQRRTDVRTILDAVYQYSIDTGAIPSTIGTSQTEICKTGFGCGVGFVDLSVLTAGAKYLVALPADPLQATTSASTGYSIYKDANNRVNVVAPYAERSVTISATR